MVCAAMRFLPRQFSFLGLLLVVIFLLIFLHYSGVLSPWENFSLGLLAPLQARVYTWGLAINNFYRPGVAADPAVQDQLIVQRNALLVENAQLKILLAEDQAQKVQTEFLAARGLAAITARVIGKNFQSDSQILTLNQGAQAGVAVGLPVIVGEGIMVAKVLAVEKNTSRILFINDSQSSLGAWIQTAEVVPGVVVGERGLALKMTLIPADQSVRVDDLVVTSGLEETVPAGLVVGLVERVEKDANSFFQTAWIKSPIDSEDLILVSILTPRPDD